MTARHGGHVDGDPVGRSRVEKGGGTFAGVKLLLCENP